MNLASQWLGWIYKDRGLEASEFGIGDETIADGEGEGGGNGLGEQGEGKEAILGNEGGGDGGGVGEEVAEAGGMGRDEG